MTLADLLRLQGHEVHSALAAAEASPPEVVLLDLGMPVIHGLELARRLHAIPGMAPARLITVTGWGQPSDGQRTRAAGIDHHLVKPVDAALLRVRPFPARPAIERRPIMARPVKSSPGARGTAPRSWPSGPRIAGAAGEQAPLKRVEVDRRRRESV